MTAEIAILNRGAIALAADSAGTIGQGDTAKIYNGFNKIFELSEHEPVGIMIYGNLDFMGLPIESLIKRYRRLLGNGSFSHISGYMKDFLEFLAAVPRTPKDEVTHASGVLYQYFGALAKRAENRIFADIKERGKYLESKINQSIKDMIDAELKDRKADTPIPGYLSKMPAGAAASWTPVVEAAIDARFSRWQLTKVNRAALIKCGLLTLQKGPLSESRTNSYCRLRC